MEERECIRVHGKGGSCDNTPSKKASRDCFEKVLRREVLLWPGSSSPTDSQTPKLIDKDAKKWLKSEFRGFRWKWLKSYSKLTRRRLEGRNTPFQEYDPLRVRPIQKHAPARCLCMLLANQFYQRYSIAGRARRMPQWSTRPFIRSKCLSHSVPLSSQDHIRAEKRP